MVALDKQFDHHHGTKPRSCGRPGWKSEQTNKSPGHRTADILSARRPRDTSISSNTSCANEIISCGYRLDSESQLYYVRNRNYNPVLGRWIQRDPIRCKGGINLYGYVMSGPVGAVDAGGAWPIDRKGGATALAKWQKGDTPIALAEMLHLNPAEIKKWATPAHGCDYYVPNTVVIDVGWSLTRDELGHQLSGFDLYWSIAGLFLSKAFAEQSLAKAAGYMVSFDGAATDKSIVSDLNKYSAAKDLLKFYYFGHGASDGYLAPGNPVRTMLVAPDRYTSYGIALMDLFACSSAAPEDPNSVLPIAYIGPNGQPASILRSQPGGTEWRLNVAPAGTFGGYTADVNLVDESFYWATFSGLPPAGEGIMTQR